MHNGKRDSEDGEIHIKRLPPDVIPVQATEHMMEVSPPYMNGDLSEGESPAETDSSEDMNMAPHRPIHPPPPTIYTNREDMVRLLTFSLHPSSDIKPQSCNTVNSLVSDHPWFTKKWSLTGKINIISPKLNR